MNCVWEGGGGGGGTGLVVLNVQFVVCLTWLVLLKARRGRLNCVASCSLFL
jgi:hypothetical protein